MRRICIVLLVIGASVGAYFHTKSHDLYCCKADPFPLLHQHPPHDSLGMAQQEGRGNYGSPNGTEAQNVYADECIKRGGNAYWVAVDASRFDLTCMVGNVAGVTTSAP